MCRLRPSWDLPLSHRRVRVAGLLISLCGSSSFSLPTTGHALRYWKASWCADFTYPRERVELGDVLQTFTSLLNPKDRAACPRTSAVNPGALAGKSPPTGPGCRTVVLLLMVRVRVGNRGICKRIRIQGQMMDSRTCGRIWPLSRRVPIRNGRQ